MNQKKRPILDEDRVFQSAKNLATMVKQHGKPLRLDLDLYMQMIVATKGPGMTEAEWDSIGDIDDLSEPGMVQRWKAAVDLVQGVLRRGEEFEALRQEFVDMLSDCFTVDEVYNIQPCLLVEEGMTSVDPDDENSPVINSWYVIPTPTDCIDLF